MSRRIIIGLLIAVFLSGCGPFYPPSLRVVEKDEIGGHLGLYVRQTNTIYLAPGADEEVLRHELAHAAGLDEREAQIYCGYR